MPQQDTGMASQPHVSHCLVKEQPAPVEEHPLSQAAGVRIDFLLTVGMRIPHTCFWKTVPL